MSPAAIDAVLLVAFGGPTAPEEIGPFLDNVTRGRGIPPARIEEVARHYERMPGSRSPLNDLTVAQARALERALAARGRPLPVHVGMRNWHPYLAETLAEMTRAGRRRALAVIMSSLRTEASWERYQQDVRDAQAGVAGAPAIEFAPGWFERAGFLDAVADRARAALDEVPADIRRWTPLIFTAHSVPVAMAEGSPYVTEFATAARAVVERLGHPRFSLAYQSRSGSPHEPWLGPDVTEVLKGLAGAPHAVVVPIGFVCDHVEILYDLDVEARARAGSLGIALHRARAVNDHPAFIAALADLVGEAP
ncbi:MAG: ferrochelatase [Candidatus Rokubacteria bacterium]|nr:ferrochelatase [Candidatus Rokubacteria bacterium]MBI3826511.1 ferrochelatase [Candidatus Rokubacteria bacterium]